MGWNYNYFADLKSTENMFGSGVYLEGEALATPARVTYYIHN